MTIRRPRTRAVAATLLAATLGLVGAACGSSGNDGAGGPSKVDGSAASVDASTTTTAAPESTVPTTTVPATTGLATQEEVAQRLYDAWYADDKVTAATVADPAAVENMWKTARGDYSLYNKCSSGEFDTSGCLYRGANGTIQFDLERRGDFWVVSGVFYSDPSSGG